MDITTFEEETENKAEGMGNAAKLGIIAGTLGLTGLIAWAYSDKGPLGAMKKASGPGDADDAARACGSPPQPGGAYSDDQSFWAAMNAWHTCARHLLNPAAGPMPGRVGDPNIGNYGNDAVLWSLWQAWYAIATSISPAAVSADDFDQAAIQAAPEYQTWHAQLGDRFWERPEWRTHYGERFRRLDETAIHGAPEYNSWRAQWGDHFWQRPEWRAQFSQRFQPRNTGHETGHEQAHSGHPGQVASDYHHGQAWAASQAAENASRTAAQSGNAMSHQTAAAAHQYAASSHQAAAQAAATAPMPTHLGGVDGNVDKHGVSSTPSSSSSSSAHTGVTAPPMHLGGVDGNVERNAIIASHQNAAASHQAAAQEHTAASQAPPGSATATAHATAAVGHATMATQHASAAHQATSKK